MSVKVGDRIRVTNPQDAFDEYEAGDTAVVTRVNAFGDVDVRWEERRFTNDKKESRRMDFLYSTELEVIGGAA